MKHSRSPSGTKQVPLSNGMFALVDESDFPKVSPFKWHCEKKKACLYAVRYVGNHRVPMHRFIRGLKKGEHVDHSNHDGLDNTRSNLRPCSLTENNRNRRRFRKSVSRFKGVSWCPDRKQWEVRVCVNYKRIRIGRFEDEEEAAIHYNVAAQLFFGPFACLNTL